MYEATLLLLELTVANAYTEFIFAFNLLQFGSEQRMRIISGIEAYLQHWHKFTRTYQSL